MNINIPHKKSVIFFIIIIITAYIINKFVYDRDSSLALVSTSFVLSFVYIIINSNSKYLVAIGCLFVIILSTEISYFLIFNEEVSFSVISSIVETNSTEAKMMFVSDGIKIISVATLIFLVIFFVVKYIDNKIRDNSQRYINTFVLASFILLFFRISNDIYINLENYKFAMKESRATPGIIIKKFFPSIFGDMAFIYCAIFSTDKFSNRTEIKTINRAILKHGNSNKNLIVLVIGESSLYSRYSVYGYEKETTPELQSIFSSKDTCIVKNVHSSAPVTRNSIPMMLAFNTPESEENIFVNKSVIDLANDSGYKTYWLGSQELEGMYDSKYGFIAKKSNFVRQTNYHDEKLPALLAVVLKDQSAKKKFVIVHLYGNHMPYGNYDEEDEDALPNAEEYDLTIHKVDRVTASLIRLIPDNKESVFIYTSDHGELVNKGHGFEKGREQYLIPFLYKNSDSKFDCSFIESFRNKNGWISALMNKFILANLLGYELDKTIVDMELNNDRVLSANEKPVPFKDIQ